MFAKNLSMHTGIIQTLQESNVLVSN